MRFIRPKNWTEFQHYKDRSPPWIKLHHNLIDDLEFNELDPFAAKVLVLLWLLASEYAGGLIPFDPPKIAFRLRLTTLLVAEALETLIERGFMVFEDGQRQAQPIEATADLAREDSGFSSRYVSDAVKRAVWARDGGKCVQCKSEENIEYDHIVPVSKKGPSTIANIRLLCRICNRKKRTAGTVEQVATPVAAGAGTVYPETETETETETQVKAETEKAPPNGSGLAGAGLKTGKPPDAAAKKAKKAKPAPPAFALPAEIPAEAWAGFEEMRQKIKKPMTDHARALIVKDLLRFHAKGYDTAKILDKATRKCWQDVYEPEGAERAAMMRKPANGNHGATDTKSAIRLGQRDGPVKDPAAEYQAKLAREAKAKARADDDDEFPFDSPARPP